MRKKLLAVLTMMVIIASILTGCGGSKVPADFVGTWNGVGMEVSGVSVSYEEYASMAEAQGIDSALEIVIKDNGSVSMNVGGEQGTTKFVEEDGKYYLQDSVDKVEIALENGQLKFTEPTSGTLFLFEK